jgi:hypothetical protein
MLGHPSRRHWLAAGASALLAAPAANAEPTKVVRLARPHFRVDAVGWYPLVLLEAALKAAQPTWAAVATDRMTDARALIELGLPRADVDVVVGMPSPERLQRLRLVPMPLYLGLFGWRVLVVPKGQAARWQGLRSRADLAKLRLMHGATWPDTQILQANGLNVVTGTYVPEMYDRVARGEADAFPRGITEAWGEVGSVAPGFEIVPELCLHYRSDLCFFVRRDDVALADTLARGLQMLLRTQRLHAALKAKHGDALRQAGLGARRVIALDNADLPDAMRRLPAAWWTPPKA